MMARTGLREDCRLLCLQAAFWQRESEKLRSACQKAVQTRFFAGCVRFSYYPRKSIAPEILNFLGNFFEFDCGGKEHFSEVVRAFRRTPSCSLIERSHAGRRPPARPRARLLRSCPISTPVRPGASTTTESRTTMHGRSTGFGGIALIERTTQRFPLQIASCLSLRIQPLLSEVTVCRVMNARDLAAYTLLRSISMPNYQKRCREYPTVASSY
jgi:hypothetical protein